MAGDRFLLRVDREGFGYKEILEVTTGSVRLIVPTASARRTLRLVLGVAAIAWLLGVNPLLSLLDGPLVDGLSRTVGSMWTNALLVGLVWGGFLATLVALDSRELRFLAAHPRQTLELRLLGVENYRTFQELRATTGGGEFRVTVNGSRERLGRILEAAGVLPTRAA